jgi:hypothetical protein
MDITGNSMMSNLRTTKMRTIIYLFKNDSGYGSKEYRYK